MSIRDHKEEVKRWLNLPDGTGVWHKGYRCDDWNKLQNPSWSGNSTYIVDDEHAEIRKQFVNDKNKI